MSKIHFTARAVDSIKAASVQKEYFDESLVGFSLRVSPLRVRTWNYLYRHQGRLRRLKLGRYPDLSLVDARRKAIEARGLVAKGSDPAASKDAERLSGTFRELTSEYLEKYSRPNKRTASEDERMIEKDFLPIWGSRKLSSLTSREIRQHLESIATRGKRGVIANHCLSLLRTMFDFAVDHELLKVNPCARMKRLVKTQVRDRVLTTAEIATLWTSLDSDTPLHAAVLRTQLLTAQRIGEVMSMRWVDLDLTEGWWTIPAERAKNGHTHRVPLSAPAVELLEARKGTTSSEWVFPAPRESSRSVLLPTVQRTVVRLRATVDFTTHDLRRTAATSLSRAGASRVLLKRILNHRDLDITARYDHHGYDFEARTALESWGRQVLAIIGEKANTQTVVAFSKR